MTLETVVQSCVLYTISIRDSIVHACQFRAIAGRCSSRRWWSFNVAVAVVVVLWELAMIVVAA
jgi:hypothetical protein